MLVMIKTDGAAKGNPGPAAIGYHIDLAHETLEHGEYVGEMTNNEAEYLAGIAALEKALELGCQDVCLQADSNLMVQQVKGVWKVKTAHLAPLREKMQQLGRQFRSFTIEHIPREENQQADRMANEGIQLRSSVTRLVSREAALTQRQAPAQVMPFGKHKGQALTVIPTAYLQWLFAEAGLKAGLRKAVEAELMQRKL